VRLVMLLFWGEHYVSTEHTRLYILNPEYVFWRHLTNNEHTRLYTLNPKHVLL